MAPSGRKHSNRSPLLVRKIKKENITFCISKNQKCKPSRNLKLPMLLSCNLKETVIEIILACEIKIFSSALFSQQLGATFLLFFLLLSFRLHTLSRLSRFPPFFLFHCARRTRKFLRYGIRQPFVILSTHVQGERGLLFKYLSTKHSIMLTISVPVSFPLPPPPPSNELSHANDPSSPPPRFRPLPFSHSGTGSSGGVSPFFALALLTTVWGKWLRVLLAFTHGGRVSGSSFHVLGLVAAVARRRIC